MPDRIPISHLRLSEPGVEVIHEREGLELEAYQDSVGVWTICCGHTSAAGPPEVVPGMVLTEDECEIIFLDDCGTFAKEVRHLVKVPLHRYEYDALASLVYNIGSTNFSDSTVLERLNAGDYVGAGEAILWWNKPPEVMNRRRGEYYQYMEGRYEARVDEAGNAC